MSRSVEVSFISETPIENIEAHNKQVSALFNESSGEIVFQVPIRGFHFEIALMEEHFNENYMESDEFPNATLEGVISKWIENSNEVEVVGSLTIHGVKAEKTFSGQMAFNDGNWLISSEFEVNAEDFGIKIPSLVRKQIAEKIIISVNAALNPR